MLQRQVRGVLYFDLAMTPHPPDAETIAVEELVPALLKMVKDSDAHYLRDNERRILHISQAKRVTSPDTKEKFLALLITLGDRDRADPGFFKFATKKNRIVKKEDDEGGALTAHMLIALTPDPRNKHIHLALLEDVPGLGRSLVQAFLRHLFRRICKEEDRIWQKEDGGEVRTWPAVELAGHQAEKLKHALKRGGLQTIELVRYEQDDEFDEQAFIRKTTQKVLLSVSPELPAGETMNLIQRISAKAAAKKYTDMRVRWRNEDMEKADSAYIPTARQDVGEALFVRSDEVQLDTVLPDCSEDFCNELLRKMLKLAEK